MTLCILLLCYRPVFIYHGEKSEYQYLILDISRDIASIFADSPSRRNTTTTTFISCSTRLLFPEYYNVEMVTGAVQRRKVDLEFYLHRVFRKTSFRWVVSYCVYLPTTL